MKTTLLCLSYLMLLFSSSLVAQTFESGPANTALIELYTSKGCNSCPPAERWPSEHKTNKALWTEFVPVAFHITYWDDLGWPDACAKAAVTERQRDYASACNSSSISPPNSSIKAASGASAIRRPGILTLKRNPDGGGTLTFKPTSAPSPTILSPCILPKSASPAPPMAPKPAPSPSTFRPPEKTP